VIRKKQMSSNGINTAQSISIDEIEFLPLEADGICVVSEPLEKEVGLESPSDLSLLDVDDAEGKVYRMWHDEYGELQIILKDD